MDGDTSTSSDSCNADSSTFPLEFSTNMVAKTEDDYERDENYVEDYLQQINRNACEDAQCPKDLNNDIPNGDSNKKEETESEDDEQPVSNHVEPNGDALLNSCILDEILSEKKKTLLESPEVAEILQQHFLQGN